MKKVLYFFAVCSASVLMLTGVSSAADTGMAGRIAEQAGYDTGGVTEYTLSRSVGNIIRSVLALIGMIFLVLTIYAGVLWMTAAGNEEKITKAKKILTSSFIGLVIVGAAYGITTLVIYFTLGGPPPSTYVDEPHGWDWNE